MSMSCIGIGSVVTPSTTGFFGAGKGGTRAELHGRWAGEGRDSRQPCYDSEVSTLLQAAIERAQTLPLCEQERLGALFLAEVEQAVREAEFDALIESRPEILEKWRAGALAEFEAGLTEPLNP